MRRRGGGSLELDKVKAAIRMVGSGFFQEMTGAKRDKSLKMYDHTAFTMDEVMEDEAQETYWVQDELDDHVLETLAAEDDEDAAFLLQFEDAINETIQNDSEMCAYYSSYQEARKRLAEKVRFRGIWSVKRAAASSTTVPTSFVVTEGDVPAELIHMAIAE